MRKWIIKIMILKLAEPILDTIIEVLEKLAKKSTNKVDDLAVATIITYKQLILDYVFGKIPEITKRSK